MCVINVSADALGQILRINKVAKPYFKIDLLPQGCSGFAYKMDFSGDRDMDHYSLVESSGLQILIRKDQEPMMNGSTLNWIKEGFASRLEVDNPNVKQACGCGLSVKF